MTPKQEKPSRIKKRKEEKMKKMILVAVAIMTMTSSFASTENDKAGRFMEYFMNARNVEDYDMTFDTRRLAAKLDLTAEQMDAVEVIQNQFTNEMLSAANSHGFQRRAQVRQAVSNDINKMKMILNDKQFDSYMSLLITTLRNRHL